MQNSFTFTESNILGTHVLLESAKSANIGLFVHVSTDEVYGHGMDGTPSHEGSILEPTNPYAATKAGAEYLVKAYHRSFGMPIIITRGNNVYGPHQYPEKIIPKVRVQCSFPVGLHVACIPTSSRPPPPPFLQFISQLQRGLPMTMHGDGSNTRNFLYVEDVARAFDVILHQGKVGEIYNIGGDNEKSNTTVAEELLRVMGIAEKEGGMPAAVSKHLVYVGDRPFNDLRYPLDCSKLAALGWTEQVSWEVGLQRTVDWYKLHSSNWAIADVESALVAHPRRGALAKEMLGLVAEDSSANLVPRK